MGTTVQMIRDCYIGRWAAALVAKGYTGLSSLLDKVDASGQPIEDAAVTERRRCFLQRLMEEYDLRTAKLHGEAAGVDEAAVEEELNKVIFVMKYFTLK